MQNEKIKYKETVMIPVPAELLLEAGIYEDDPMQMYADPHLFCLIAKVNIK